MSFETHARKLLGSCIVVALITVLFIGGLAFLAPGRASAASFDLLVYGYVTDSVGAPVQGASVVIEDLTTHNTYSASATDEFGQYTFDIPAAEWTPGDSLHVTATFGTASGSNDGVAPPELTGQVEIDVSLSVAIPEFGSALGVLLVACFVGVVAIVYVGKRKA